MNLYRINLNLLIALDILLLEQSVTLAAKKLFITQAAMSNNLQQLRVLFKDDLLVRNKNRMVLTHYAKELQPRLHQVLQEVQCVMTSGQRFEPETSERVFKIAISDYLAALLLPKLINNLQRSAPKMKIVAFAVTHINDTESLERGDYDLAISKLPTNSTFPCKQFLFQDKIVCIMNHKHPLAKKKKITLNEYLANKHIAVRADNPHYSAPMIEQALEKLGHRRDIRISVPFIVPIFKMIEQSENLIATVLKSTTDLYNTNHCFTVKELPFKLAAFGFYQIWHPRFDNDIAHKWLRERIKEISVF